MRRENFELQNTDMQQVTATAMAILIPVQSTAR